MKESVFYVKATKYGNYIIISIRDNFRTSSPNRNTIWYAKILYGVTIFLPFKHKEYKLTRRYHREKSVDRISAYIKFLRK